MKVVSLKLVEKAVIFNDEHVYKFVHKKDMDPKGIVSIMPSTPFVRTIPQVLCPTMNIDFDPCRYLGPITSQQTLISALCLGSSSADS